MSGQKLQTNLIGQRVKLSDPRLSGIDGPAMATRMGLTHEAYVETYLPDLVTWDGKTSEVCTASLDEDGTPVYQVRLDDGQVVTGIYALSLRVEA